MDENEFWDLISLVDYDALEACDDDEAVAPILMGLSERSESAVHGFHEQLARLLYAIDGKKWMDESGEARDSGDGFLYARCYVVAKGRDYYEKVLNNPSLMPKSSDQWAESLLYVTAQAWAGLTGNDEEDFDWEASVSHESFSNERQW